MVVVVAVACLLRLLLAPDLEAVVVAVAVGARLLVCERLLALDREEVAGGLVGGGGGGAGCLVVVPGPVAMGGVVSISASSMAC